MTRQGRQEMKKYVSSVSSQVGGGEHMKERLCSAGCCHALLPMLVLPLSGMAASSLLMQRYSPSIAMMAKPIRLVSHHAQECGKPA